RQRGRQLAAPLRRLSERADREREKEGGERSHPSDSAARKTQIMWAGSRPAFTIPAVRRGILICPICAATSWRGLHSPCSSRPPLLPPTTMPIPPAVRGLRAPRGTCSTTPDRLPLQEPIPAPLPAIRRSSIFRA